MCVEGTARVVGAWGVLLDLDPGLEAMLRCWMWCSLQGIRPRLKKKSVY